MPKVRLEPERCRGLSGRENVKPRKGVFYVVPLGGGRTGSRTPQIPITESDLVLHYAHRRNMLANID